LRYDTVCFGFPRPRFLKPWLIQPESHAFKFLDGGVLKGYAMVRRATQGFKVCPLFADSPEIATELYKACLNAVPGQSLFIDIPMANTNASQLISQFNTNFVFECARMYYGKPPDIPMEKIYGLTTLELG